MVRRCSGDVVERNRRWSSHTNLALAPSEAVYGKLGFVGDASLTDDAIVDFYIEYDDWVFGQTEFCTLKDIVNTNLRECQSMMHGSNLIWFQSPRYIRVH